MNDNRNINYDLYAQRIDSDGSINLDWTVDGDIVCAATGGQAHHEVCSDGMGGAKVAWVDDRLPYSGGDLAVFTQRIGSNGATQWTPVDGVPICTTTKYNDVRMQICSDGAGGAIISWTDNRTGILGDKPDIYAQRINISGEIHYNKSGKIKSKKGTW